MELALFLHILLRFTSFVEHVQTCTDRIMSGNPLSGNTDIISKNVTLRNFKWLYKCSNYL